MSVPPGVLIAEEVCRWRDDDRLSGGSARHPKARHDGGESRGRWNSVNTLNLDTKNGDACQFCGHRFIRSFYSFLPLPLVEFFSEDGIPQGDVETLLHSLPPLSSSSAGGGRGGGRGGRDADGWNEEFGGDGESGYQRLSLASSSSHPRPSSSSFSQRAGSAGGRRVGGGMSGMSGTTLGAFKNTQFGSLMYQVQHGNASLKLTLSRDGLKELPPDSVFIAKYPPPLRWRYFVNLVDSIPIILCSSCFHFFTEEDFAMSIYSTGRCPFCYTPLNQLSEDIQKRYVIKNKNSTDSALNASDSRTPRSSSSSSSSSSSDNKTSPRNRVGSDQPPPPPSNRNKPQMTVSSGVWRMPTFGKKN